MNLVVNHYYRFEEAEAIARALNDLGETVTRVADAFNGLERSVADLKSRMDELQSQVGELPSQGVSPDALASALLVMESEIVSKLSDKLDVFEKSVDAAIGRVQSDVEKLNGKIAELQALVDSGSASDADIARLEALQAKLDALDPTVDSVLPPEPTPEPVPTPEPAPEPTPAEG